MRRLLPFVLSLCCAFSGVPAQAATTFYVSTTGSDANSGSTASPFATIQQGLTTAASGDTVEVMAGTYSGAGNRDLTFAGKGISLRGASGVAKTIIDCNATATDSHRAFSFTSQETASAVVQGFTITRGLVSGNGEVFGGAIFISDASPTIRNCIFRRNQVISDTKSRGGAVAVLKTTGTTRPTFENCIFTANSAGEGLAFYTQLGSTTTIRNCTISGNPTAIKNNYSGAAVYNNEGVVNVRNSIIYGNSDLIQIQNEGRGICDVTYSDVDSYPLSEGSFAAPPGFVSDTNFEIPSSSPCFNAGSDADAPPDDILGVPRPQAGRVDIGAYEIHNFNESLVVTTSIDENNGTSDPSFGAGTSLREAIEYANSHPGPDTISFGTNLYSTINWANAVPDITGELTISGPATRSFQLDNNSGVENRFFTIRPGAVVTIKNLTFSRGGGPSLPEGGAIYNEGSLTLSNCTFVDNRAINHGGAVYNRNGTLFIFNCSLTRNSATGSDIGSGGAIYNENGQITVKNCTLSSNTAALSGGGIATYGASPTKTTLSNSIVSQSTGGDVNFLGGLTNTFVSQGYNLIGDGNAISTFVQNGDRSGVTPDQLKLTGLTKTNGSAPYIALQEGSIAIDAGNTTLTTDQRALPRPQGKATDIGAFEFNAITDGLTVTTLEDENDGTNDSTWGTGRSLREALISANQRQTANTITFAPGLSGTIGLKYALDTITSDLTLNGPTGKGIAISGSYGGRVLDVTGGVTLILRHLTIKGGHTSSPDAGAGIRNKGRLIMEGCTLTANYGNEGGGLYSNTQSSPDWVTVIRNCTFSGNTADRNGGAICNVSGQMLIENCTISGNNAYSLGGGIYSSDQFGASKTIIANSIVAGNGTRGDLSNPGFSPSSPNPFVSQGYNLVGTGSGNATAAFIAPGDQRIGLNAPGLSELTDTGGPTLAMALLPNSRAINAGNPNFDGAAQTDQRGPGYERVKYGRLDIGAIESNFDSPPTIAINTPAQNQSLTISAFNGITGTASDNLGVFKVLVKLWRVRDGVTTYWNGTSFTSTPTTVTAYQEKPVAVSTSWGLYVSPELRAALDNGPYLVAAYAQDTAGTLSGAVGRNFTLFTDSTAPVPVITNPTINQTLTATSFTTINGTVTDDVATVAVNLKLFRIRDGVTSYWDGSAFTPTPAQFPAAVANTSATSTTWTYSVSQDLKNALDSGPYGVVAYAKDAVGHQSNAVGRNFNLDVTLPAPVILTPTQNQNLLVQNWNSITGSATDNVGVAQVQLKLFRSRDGVLTYWNGSAFSTTPALLTASLSATGAPSTNWNYAITPALKAALDSGPYLLTAYAKDSAGNVSSAVGRNFNLSSDAVSPTLTFTAPGQNQALTAEAFASITGNASDNNGVTGVQLKLFRIRDGVIEYWNGATFTSTVALLDASLATPSAASTSWSYTVSNDLRAALQGETYYLVGYARDAAGNQNAGVGRTFSILASGALRTGPSSQAF